MREDETFGGTIQASITCPACGVRFVLDPPEHFECPRCGWKEQVSVHSFWPSALRGVHDGVASDGGGWRSTLDVRAVEGPPTCRGCGAVIPIEALLAHLPTLQTRYVCGTCGRGMVVWDGMTWLVAMLWGVEVVIKAHDFYMGSGSYVRCVRCGEAVFDVERPYPPPKDPVHQPCPTFPRDVEGREPGWFVFGQIRGQIRRLLR